jgi:hypothetical protein
MANPPSLRRSPSFERWQLALAVGSVACGSRRTMSTQVLASVKLYLLCTLLTTLLAKDTCWRSLLFIPQLLLLVSLVLRFASML